MRYTAIVFLIVLLICFQGCQDDNKKLSRKDFAQAKNKLAKINSVLVDQDRSLIEHYIKRHNLDGVKESGTGLFYLIWGDSKGDLIKTGNVVEYSYKITLLDGALCYQSEKDTPKRFKVGHGLVESGLEQAVLLMKPGQKGKFILPPHLAYGLLGDEKMIPSRSIIVYDIEMLKVYR
ncbi:MAG: FKBP-type peptidyl-prolyl cis-trans isomerase [Bacteroidales bacterium]|nr:FKBP-type peptidyl-prolyl cis-trans isomerase [Bacteroidales bacterium]